MKAHGLLFMGDMARAMVLRQKTATRRIIAPHNSLIDGHGMRSWDRYGTPLWDKAWVDDGPSPAGNTGPYLHLPFSDGTTHRIYPRINAGDTIWGKETWTYKVPPDSHAMKSGVKYRADNSLEAEAVFAKWKSSMFMPRWASRIERTVQAVCCQRANQLDDVEIAQEGILNHTKDGDLHKYGVEGWPWTDWQLSPLAAWRKLWIQANGPESWDANPWVWGYKLSS